MAAAGIEPAARPKAALARRSPKPVGISEASEERASVLELCITHIF
jgi:hypothetical protein